MNGMSHQQFLEVVRSHELLGALSEFPAPQEGTRRRTVLEIGAGTGQQARMLQEYGFEVIAIDLPTSHYRRDRIFDVIEYDGRTISCAADSIDVVFSSNVLEHVAEIDSFLDETIRVMAPNGLAIHFAHQCMPNMEYSGTLYLAHEKVVSFLENDHQVCEPGHQ